VLPSHFLGNEAAFDKNLQLDNLQLDDFFITTR
jgi:hypothetical protein